MRRVVITPLDWGLGHATRCIPVISELQRHGCEVFIAGSGDSLELLREEFPGLKTYTIPGYRPRYPRHGSMAWTIAAQLPHFQRTISSEHKALSRIIKEEKADIVISDNRYGCWSQQVRSVFITHQTNILMPRGWRWLGPTVRKANIRLINRFDTCWIPDLPGDQSLAGDLASRSDAELKIGCEFLGWLSRFDTTKTFPKKYDVIMVLSGPEPQRTVLENIVVPQLKASGLAYRVVRGLPGMTSKTDERLADFLPSNALEEELASAELVIARSGYSTVMDMQALGKKVVFVPTPGQTEQEYLSKRLMEKGIAFSMSQDEFKLDVAMAQSKGFTGFRPPTKNNLLKDAVLRLLNIQE